MRNALAWLWKNGIVSTFATGLFVLLPFVITMAIMGWFASVLVNWLGPKSLVGGLLEKLGAGAVQGSAGQAVATLMGWTIVLVGIWFVGLLVKTAARQRVESAMARLMDRIPVVNSIYRTVAQVVGMMKKDEGSDMRGMSVVYCVFGEAHGGGFLALLVAKQQFQFAGRPCHAVFIPAAPLPMSGGIVFVPIEKVQQLDMSVDDLMQVYFSMGVMSPKVIPEQYQKELLQVMPPTPVAAT